MSGGFQTSVTTGPAPAIAGDFASANPRFSFDAGPGGAIAGPSGVTVGLFAWVAAYPADGDGAGCCASNAGAGVPTGFIHREQQALITQYLGDAGNVIPAGFPVTLMTGGDFWAKNDGSTFVVPGQKAYAANATGKLRFGASGSATAGAASNASTISAQTASVTGSINGNVMTVTAIGSGILVPGGVLAGAAGSAGGDAVPSGLTIVKQLSGTAVGGVGTYAVNIGSLNVTSTTITETYGLLTVGGTVTGTFAVNDKLTGTGVAANSTITGLGTGVGLAGTYYTQTQTASSTSIGAESDVETKWYAMSSGRPGELVKISDHPTG